MTTIFVRLKDEGTDVWRPVAARHVDADIFEIVAENNDPENENWEFRQGQTVRCKQRTTAEGENILVAHELLI